MTDSTIDFSTYTPVNHLWPAFVERLGAEKAQQAVRQALDAYLVLYRLMFHQGQTGQFFFLTYYVFLKCII